LKHHHEQQLREREAAGTAWQHGGHMFTTAQGGPIDPTNLTRTFTTFLRKAGSRRIRFNDLRYTTAILRRPRPLTLPSATAVTPRRSPARTHLTGLHFCYR
jgi:hypothetical protein